MCVCDVCFVCVWCVCVCVCVCGVCVCVCVNADISFSEQGVFVGRHSDAESKQYGDNIRVSYP